MIQLNIFQIFQDFPEGEYPENNPFNTIMGYGNTFLFIIIVIIVWFIVSSLLAFWTYKDIKKKQFTGYKYVPIVFFTSFIGLVIYYLVRYNEKCALEFDEEACLLDDDSENQNQ